jgi:class 3 adenylate cyclase
VQAFRDWAQNEPFPPGESLEVRRVALWFSDLSGSTALYARRGDPRAFQLVREHFDVLFAAVSDAGGAVVKTIGDSVMAVFTSGREALGGALAGYTALAEFNRQRSLPPDDRLALKVGLHAGPSIAVTLNDRLDYFGQTVNLAARLAGLAQPGDVVLSEAVCEEPGVRELLSGYLVDEIETPVKGLDAPVVAHRVTAQRE